MHVNTHSLVYLCHKPVSNKETEELVHC
uniref:Uncharacterized protein n=1 Tax=Anguilla anguilla TaxID=7936 RepID=A0A0E9XTC6_ANGAN